MGDEEVTIVEGDIVKRPALNQTDQLFEAKKLEILILFTNDNGPRDVFFRSKVPRTIKSSNFMDWKCGLSTEEPGCNDARNGMFLQSATYTITFKGNLFLFSYFNSNDSLQLQRKPKYIYFQCYDSSQICS